MFRFVNKFIALSTLAIIATACSIPNYQSLFVQNRTSQPDLTSLFAQSITSHSDIRSDMRQKNIKFLKEQHAHLAYKQDKDYSKRSLKDSRIAQAIAPEKLSPDELVASKVVLGTLKGSACNKNFSVDVHITKLHEKDDGFMPTQGILADVNFTKLLGKGGKFKINGTFRSSSISDNTSSIAIETPMEGEMTGGFLNLNSSSKPLTKQEVDDEYIRRKRAVDEYEALAFVFDGAYTYASMVAHHPDVIQKMEEHYIAEYNREIEFEFGLPPIPPSISLHLDVGRDGDGKGWVGVIEGDGFKDCHDIVLVNGNGITTSKLPAITGQIAFGRSMTKSKVFKEYWLNVAASKGYDDAYYLLGTFYEEQGKNSPDDYRRALQNYRTAIEKASDTRAQAALGRMYANGLGTPVNPAEAKKWMELASETNRVAAEVCVSPKTIAVISSIMSQQVVSGKVGGMLMGGMTGLHVDPGSMRVEKISASGVVSANKPFICLVEGTSVGRSADASGANSYVYDGIHNGQHTWIRDESYKIVMEGTAFVINHLSDISPYQQQSFVIEPLGDHRYKLASKIIDLGLGDSVVKNKEVALTVRLTADGQQPKDEHQIIKDCTTCPEMVVIPSGEFKMGYRSSIEKSGRNVSVNAFALGKTEVTQIQWRAVMGSNPSKFSSCGDDCPVEQVSWDSAQEFIKKLNAMTGKQYRLPSETEWEYACRAGKQQEYCGSDILDKVGWYDANSEDTTHPVARKQPNAFGLYDMSGNVMEWLEVSNHPRHRGMHELRGGAWHYSARAAERGMLVPPIGYSFAGFRVARILP
ncbi:SUMF1/EgtB/PvdO family nonheme iron enzyme [Candidatus Nitrotoga arctica]|uniref:Sulfatase-modifying factor enzyme-like domain-containing protein n=1 Tax=Candidatus Nitrotoga arctica TaxID=453162 RepID=A0ABM8YWX6_9PROT|nr:SUMF1/EgtB/PvdO family nonheme iron enzyme [Candidatus Nitrotoga arctica]CAG9931997.1 exported protein of unknown function [Candidatus Nitrotoga arctica]